ncbi:MAG TPA: methyl-accepting chemotaxis protein [Clostridiaceae bacterium]
MKLPKFPRLLKRKAKNKSVIIRNEKQREKEDKPFKLLNAKRKNGDRKIDLKGIKPGTISFFESNSKKFTKFSRGISIKSRLTIAFVAVILIPLSVIGANSFIQSSKALNTTITSYSAELTSQVGNNINATFKKCDDLTVQIAYDTKTQAALDNASSKTVDEESKISSFLTLSTSLANQIAGSGLITGLDIYPLTGETIGTNTSISTETLKDLQQKSSTLKSGGLWSLASSQLSDKVLVFCRPINSSNLNEITAYGVVVLNPTKLYAQMGKINYGKGSDFFIVDDKGLVVSMADHTVIGKPLNYKGLSAKLNSKEKNLATKQDIKPSDRVFNYTSGKINDLVTYYSIPGTNWYFVATIPNSSIFAASIYLLINTILVSMIIFVIGILLSLMISKSISNPLKDLVLLMNNAKDGNLNIKSEYKNNDEIGFVIKNFNEMVSKISSLIMDVKVLSQNLTSNTEKISDISEHSYTSAEEIAATMQDIAKGASEQALSATDGVSYMSTLADGINTVDIDMLNVSKQLAAANELKTEASNSVKALNEKAMETSTASDKIVKEINDLNDSMKEIKSIVKLIVGIAEQTNLLSLNAAIEAARAGEAGRGFAVVADEVRKLADKSKEASKKINIILNVIQDKAQLTTNEANSTRLIIHEQMDAVNKTEDAFQVIFNAIGNITSQMEHMSLSVKDILKAKDNTLNAIEGISSVSEETAATTEEISASTQEQIAGAMQLSSLSEELAKMTSNLNEAISYFKTEK